MARLIIILALIAGFIMLYRSLFGGANPPRDDRTETADMAQDPNCGTYVSKRQAITKSIQGKEHFFVVKNVLTNIPLKKNKYYKHINRISFGYSVNVMLVYLL